jgi:alpha-L-fucosidase 2
MLREGFNVNKFLLGVIVAVCAIECRGLTKIACIGNSITYGYRLGNPSTQSYPGRLQALLGTANYTVQNDGVNSATMSKKGNVPYWTSGKLSDIVAFKPDIITIKLGTNDSKPQNWDNLGYGTQFRTDYLAMIDTLTALPSHPKLYLILPVPVFDNTKAAQMGIRDSVVQNEIPIIKDIAVRRGLPVIDANTPLKKFPQCFSVDGVHPDEVGEDTIAHIVYRALTATSIYNPHTRPSIPIIVNKCGIAVLPSMTRPLPLEVFDITGKLITSCIVPAAAPQGTLISGNLRFGAYIVRVSNKKDRSSIQIHHFLRFFTP